MRKAGVDLQRRLKKLVSSGMSKEEIAAEMGVSLATVYRWLAGDVSRPMRTVIAALERVEKAHAS